MLRKETVSAELLDNLLRLVKLPCLKNHRLVGGTALALQIGHRKSIDIDFFCDVTSDYAEIEKDVCQEFGSEVKIERYIKSSFGKGICFNLQGVKTDIFDWNNPFKFPAIHIENIPMASKEEILRMELDIITSPSEFIRFEKKDFIDLVVMLNEFPLSVMIKIYADYHPQIQKSERIIIEALQFAKLADKKPNPNMLIPLTWQDAKNILQKEINTYMKLNFDQ
jgi:hypothetical protein